jgi:hypothetical protein
VRLGITLDVSAPLASTEAPQPKHLTRNYPGDCTPSAVLAIFPTVGQMPSGGPVGLTMGQTLTALMVSPDYRLSAAIRMVSQLFNRSA